MPSPPLRSSLAATRHPWGRPPRSNGDSSRICLTYERHITNKSPFWLTRIRMQILTQNINRGVALFVRHPLHFSSAIYNSWFQLQSLLCSLFGLKPSKQQQPILHNFQLLKVQRPSFQTFVGTLTQYSMQQAIC